MAVPSKDFDNITDAEIDVDSPLTTGLFVKMRDALVHLEEWLGLSFTAAQDHDHDGVNSKLVIGADFILVEKKIITSDTALSTFSGLSGETDEVYKMIMRIRFPALSGIEKETWNIKPNGITASQNNTATGTLRMELGATSGAGGIGVIMFEVLFYARHTVNSIAQERLMTSEFMRVSPIAVGTIGSRWTDTSTTITSLEIESVATGGAPANGILDGSTIALYKLRQ